jgi:DHA2 family multidrug resistance protein
LDITNPVVSQRVANIKNGLIAKGVNPLDAQTTAYKFLDFSVMKQASVLSYMDVFHFIGIIFIICIPFVMMVKGNKK